MNQPDNDTMRPEYDFSTAARGKHHRAFRRGTNLLSPEPDVGAVFKDPEAGNDALRKLDESATD